MATTAAMERILKENLLEAIRKVKEISPKRNFVESIELILPVYLIKYKIVPYIARNFVHLSARIRAISRYQVNRPLGHVK